MKDSICIRYNKLQYNLFIELKNLKKISILKLNIKSFKNNRKIKYNLTIERIR